MFDLNEQEIKMAAQLFCEQNDLKAVRIKPNVKEILKKKIPSLKNLYEDAESTEFFEKFAGREVHIFREGKSKKNFLILEDNNIFLTADCFEEL